ncbi:hypothetical protein L3Q82_002440 [Scortum barcoo]|uniref:Uncharacterized protein n=1 Tax=Scortum barcoo TaxID=214431 RepID=A0ACB8VY84_9TELE|nr:hypothetical protein L3Q82_002440 [Scortum barcoo]
MRISTSKSEAMVLDRKRVACPLRVGGEVLPQVEEFKYLGVLFTSEGKMEREIDRWIGAASAVMRSCTVNRTVRVIIQDWRIFKHLHSLGHSAVKIIGDPPLRLFPPGYRGRGMSYGKACTALPEPEAAFSSDDSTKPNHRHSTSGDRAKTTQRRGCLCVCVCVYVAQRAQQADHSMLPTIDFLLCVPIFTWKCNKTVIIPTLPIFLPDNPPTPHYSSPPTLSPPRQLLLRVRLPSGERLTTAYQPLAHHTAGTVAQREREVERERERERERDEREEELMKGARMAKEMCEAVER